MRGKRLRERTATLADLMTLARSGQPGRFMQAVNYPDLPAEVITCILSRDIDRITDYNKGGTYYKLALSSHLQDEHLSVLSTWAESYPALFSALVENPSVSDYQLVKHFARFVELGCNNHYFVMMANAKPIPASIAHMLYRSVLSHDAAVDAEIVTTAFQRLACNPTMPPELLGKLSVYPVEAVVRVVASNPSLPVEYKLKIRVSHFTPDILAEYFDEEDMKMLPHLYSLPEETTLEEAIELLKGKARDFKSVSLTKSVKESSSLTSLRAQAGSSWVTFLKDSTARFNTAAQLTETLAANLDIPVTGDMVSNLENASLETLKMLGFYEQLLEVSESPRTFRALESVKTKLEDSLDSYERVVDALLNLNDAPTPQKAQEAVSSVLSHIAGWSQVRAAETFTNLKANPGEANLELA